MTNHKCVSDVILEAKSNKGKGFVIRLFSNCITKKKAETQEKLNKTCLHLRTKTGRSLSNLLLNSIFRDH